MRAITEYPIDLRLAESDYETAVNALRRANSHSEFRHAEARVTEAKRKLDEIAEAVAHGRSVANIKVSQTNREDRAAQPEM